MSLEFWHFCQQSLEYAVIPTVIAQSAWAVEYTDCFSECPGYDTKWSDGEVPVMLEIWGIWSTPSLP